MNINLASEIDSLLAESQRLPESTAESARGYRQQIALGAMAIPGLPKMLPNVVRKLDLIPQLVRNVLCEVALGVKPWPFFLHGGVGTGKTCAALWLLDCSGGRYWTAQELVDQIQDAQQGRFFTTGVSGATYPASPEYIWAVRVSGPPVVVLDEIGSRQAVSDHHYACVKRLVDLRSRKPAVYVSNLSPDELAAVYDDRLASRLCAGTVLEVQGPDRRITC